MFGRRKDSLQELIRSEGASLRELTRSQQEDSKRYWEKRDEEFRATQADLHRLREEAEARAEETREFNREILLRNEKVYKGVIAQMEENTAQIRANTQAVLAALDHFNGPEGMAA